LQEDIEIVARIDETICGRGGILTVNEDIAYRIHVSSISEGSSSFSVDEQGKKILLRLQGKELPLINR